MRVYYMSDDITMRCPFIGKGRLEAAWRFLCEVIVFYVRTPWGVSLYLNDCPSTLTKAVFKLLSII